MLPYDMNPSEVKKITCFFICSCLLHGLCFMPKKYVEIRKNPRIIETPTVYLKSEIESKLSIKTHKKTEKISHEEINEIISKIYIPGEITEIPARLKNLIDIHDDRNDYPEILKVKIWVSKEGKADKVEIIDHADQNVENIKKSIMASEFSPAIYNNKPVNSILYGELYLKNEQ